MKQLRYNILSARNGAMLVIFMTILALLIIGACTTPTPPPPPPPPPNQPPVIESITALKEILTSTDTQIVAKAGDADGDNITYKWSADGGTITGEGNIITWTAPITSDNYTINVTVSDGKGGTATESTSIVAIEKPNQTPIIHGLTIDGAAPTNENLARQWVTKTIHCNAEDPDGDQLTYLWRATGGKITGEGSTVGWTSPGTNGEYTITVVVSDGRDGRTDASLVFKVLCCGRG